MRNYTRFKIVVLGSILASFCATGCDSDEPENQGTDSGTDLDSGSEGNTSPAAPGPFFAPASDYIFDAEPNPVEYTAFEFSIPLDTAALDEIGSQLFGAGARALAAQGPGATTTIPLFEGLSLEVRSSAATSNQIEIALISEPVGSAYPEPIVLTRVPASLEYGDLFFQAAQQAFAVVGVDPSQTDFYVGWEGHSALGGSLALRVEHDALVIKGNTPRLAILGEQLGQPAFDAQPWERLSAMAPVSLGYGSLRGLILGVSGGNTDGDRASGSCGTSDTDAVTAPHSWYQFCVDVGDPIVVRLGYRLLDRSVRTLTNAPATGASANLWALSADRLAANAAAGIARDGSNVTFYYSDPGFEGEALIHLFVDEGRMRITHEHTTPPHELLDVEHVERPDPALSAASSYDPDSEDPCAVVGGVEAEEGRFFLRFFAGESLTEFSNTEFPISGRLIGGLFRADEVGLTGPLEGAEQLDSFSLDFTLGATPSEAVYETIVLPAGDYKVTAYLDLNYTPDSVVGEVERGDPAVLPFEGTILRCDRQMNTIEFGVLVP